MKSPSRYAFIVVLLALVFPFSAFAQLDFPKDQEFKFSPGDVALPGGGTAAINNPVSIAVGDFNNDGKPDMAVINGLPIKVGSEFKFYLSVFLGTGNGGSGAFGDPVVTEIGGPCPSNTKNLLDCDRGVFIMKGRFDADPNDDLAIIFFGNPGANPAVPGKVEIFLSNGDGTFAAPTPYTVGLGAIRGVVADFDNDTNLDIAVANREDNSVSLLFGNGDGTFTAGDCNGAGAGTVCDQTTSGIGKRPVALAAADFDGDGNPDLAVVNTSDNDVTILLYDPIGGGFKQTPCSDTKDTCTVGTLPFGIAAADFNGDGDVDLAVADGKAVTMLLGDGTGKFTSPAKKKTTLAKVPVDFVVGDFNGDGTQDLAFAFFSGHTVGVFPGIGDGTFGAPASFKSTGTLGAGSTKKSIGNFAIAAGDFNRQADCPAPCIVPTPIREDLAVANGDISVFFNETVFPLSTTSINVTAPSGGATVTIGSTTPITWTTTDFPGGNVKIEFSTDGGATFTKTISKGVAANLGTFSWKVPQPATPTARIRICSVNYPGLCGESGDFTIQ